MGAIPSPWKWQPHPEVWLLLIMGAGAYAWAVNVLGPRRTGLERAASPREVFCFYSGLILLWLSADWPLHELAEDYLFSAHMVQHLIYMLVVPPLLLLGIPRWLWRLLLAPRPVFAAMRFATRPLIALAAFNGMVAFIHWPAIVELQVSNELAHLSVHGLILGASLLMWWPVVAPLPELGSLSEPAKMFYLFLTSILPTVPASFLTFARGVLYEHYAHVPRLWGISPQTDQMMSGLIMKIGGGLLLWAIIAVMFFRWYAREEQGRTEEVSWEDFERELQARGMRK